MVNIDFQRARNALKTNIYSLYVIKIAKWFNLIMPTVVLFYQSNGMSMQDIFLLKSIYSVAIVLFEIPSGYLADAWGRRITLILGAVLGALGFLIYSINQVYIGFVAAEIILGLGHSFISGADTAMLFDTLKSENRAYLYLKQEGRITACGNFAEALAGIAGGLLATLSLRAPFYVQTLVAASAIPAALLLKEPALHEIRKKQTFTRLMQTIHHTLLRDSGLRSAILISSLTGTATLTFAWFVQPYFKAAGLPLPFYGLMWTLLNLSVGISGLFAAGIEKKLSEKNSLIFIVLLISAGYFLAGKIISRWGILLLFFFYGVRGLATPILKAYVNHRCESEVRASILSLRNFIIRINFAVISPILGWITDTCSLKATLWLGGAMYLAAAGTILFGSFTFPVGNQFLRK